MFEDRKAAIAPKMVLKEMQGTSSCQTLSVPYRNFEGGL